MCCKQQLFPDFSFCPGLYLAIGVSSWANLSIYVVKQNVFHILGWVLKNVCVCVIYVCSLVFVICIF